MWAYFVCHVLITKERPWKAPTKVVDGVESFNGVYSIFIG
jgi:hypothetical protein